MPQIYLNITNKTVAHCFRFNGNLGMMPVPMSFLKQGSR